MAKLVNLVARGVITRATGRDILHEWFDKAEVCLKRFLGEEC